MQLTPNQELFSRNIVQGMNQSEAYRDAYRNNMTDKQIHEEASKLIRIPKVSQRIQELQEKIDEKLMYSIVSSFKNLEEMRQLALKPHPITGKRDLSNAIKTEELKGKLAGLYKEKKEDLSRQRVETVFITPEQVKEAEEIIRRGIEE